MIILGAHCGHNSSAALMVDGAIVGAVQEERFTKRKNQVAFPKRAIAHLIDRHLGGEAGRIDSVVFASRKADPIGLAVARYSDFEVADHIRENHQYWKAVFYDGRPNDGSYWHDMYRRGECLNQDHNVDVDKLMSLPLNEAIPYLNSVERPAAMRRSFGWDGAVEQADHHACHAYYAFYGAPIARDVWDDVLVITADSWGDDKNWSAWTVDRNGTLAEIGSGADNVTARVYRFVTLAAAMCSDTPRSCVQT